MEKQRIATEKAFREHDVLVSQSNTLQQHYWQIDMPLLLTDYQKLEVILSVIVQLNI